MGQGCACMRVYVHTCVRACMHLYACVHACVCVSAHVRACVCRGDGVGERQRLVIELNLPKSEKDGQADTKQADRYHCSVPVQCGCQTALSVCLSVPSVSLYSI